MALCMMLALLLSACGPVADEHSSSAGKGAFARFEDDAGREVTLPGKPERIVVTSASFLEPLHAVGGTVVGRPDSRTKMPEFAKDIASVGKVYQIDVEKVLSCNPDFLIVNKGMNEKLVQTMADNGIPVAVVDMKSYEDVKRELRLFALVTGEKEKGEQMVSSMEERIEAVREKLPKEKRRVAILHSTNQGLSVQLDGSIAGSVAKMLGWENVAAGMTPMEKNPDAAPYSLETLVEQNPEIIFVTSMGKIEEIKKGMEKTIQENPAWQAVPAIRENRLYYLPQDLFLLSPGIHYPEAVEMMAALIYPEVFRP